MDTATALSRSELIRTINDRCRKHFLGCQVVITPGVVALEELDRARLLKAVRDFDRFGDENDPHQEHDFGAIEMHGQKWFFKMDYYLPDMRTGSDDPSDVDKTRRVLTVMHASEY
jgi:Protein of unknown function (DUF3768)